MAKGHIMKSDQYLFLYNYTLFIQPLKLVIQFSIIC